MIHNPVSIDEMRDQLLTLDQVREKFAETEPLGERKFQADVGVEFTLPDDWHERKGDGDVPLDGDEPLEGAIMRISGEGEGEYQLTKNSILEVGSACRITRGYQQAIPAGLLGVNLDWWFANGHGEKEFKVLTHESDNRPTVVAFTRGTITPFSNFHLMDAVLAGVSNKYGGSGDVLADYKFSHSVERTHLRLIVPGQQRVITGTNVADDTWSVGLQLKNSLIGLKKTMLDGYLFRWWCTNGCIDTLATTGGFSRRSEHTPEDAYEWARTSVDAVLGGLEGTLDSVQALTSIPVNADATLVLRDLFAQYQLPHRERDRVIAEMADSDELNMYGLMNAITRTANAEDVPVSAREQLMTMGGHTAHAVSGRCGECRRLLPEGYEVPVAH